MPHHDTKFVLRKDEYALAIYKLLLYGGDNMLG